MNNEASVLENPDQSGKFESRGEVEQWRVFWVNHS